MDKILGVRGLTFRIERPRNRSYQRDSVFFVAMGRIMVYKPAHFHLAEMSLADLISSQLYVYPKSECKIFFQPTTDNQQRTQI